MATPHNVIVTAKTGPGSQVTALNILNVETVNFDLVGKRLHVEVDQSNAATPPSVDNQSDYTKEFDLTAAAAITVAVAAGAYTITVVA